MGFIAADDYDKMVAPEPASGADLALEIYRRSRDQGRKTAVARVYSFGRRRMLELVLRMLREDGYENAAERLEQRLGPKEAK